MTSAAPRRGGSLRPDAVGLLDGLVIGLASTSPAYSLAAIVGPLVALVGVHAPGVLLASFLPMLLVAGAFAALDRADPDCGTTFSWVTRAMGPWAGWLGGWAIAMTGVLVIGSLAEVGVRFGLRALGLDAAADSRPVVVVATVLLILAMTRLSVLGTELSARVQRVLLAAQLTALLVFAVVALTRALTGGSPLEGATPDWTWLDPVGAGGAGLAGGLLLGVFAYWGWESALNLTEETRGGAATPGRAGIAATVALLATYLVVTCAVVAFAGPAWLAGNAAEEEAVFATLASEVLGPADWVLLLAVATAAVAATQTTILPASRTALSMARRSALPPALARVHPRHRTPDVSTWWVGGVAAAWFVAVGLASQNALFDSITALSLLIALYYALSGAACAVLHRRALTRGLRPFLLLGAGPVTGALLLAWLMVLSVRDLADPATSYTGQAWFGVGPPLVIAAAILVSGGALALWWRRRDATFWREESRPTT